MKVVKPISIGTANYAKSPDTYGYLNTGDYPAWNVATAYAVGDRVIVDSLQSAFECVSSHTGTTPTLTMTTPWVRIGASNAWKPFDAAVSAQLVGYAGGDQAVDLMRIRLTGLGRFSTVCVLATDASRVRVKFTDPNGTETYNTLRKAVDTTPVIDAWTYCFADLNVSRDFVFDGIDGWGSTADSILDIIVSNDASGTPVRIGEIVVGLAVDIGECHAGPELSLIDYSRKETNEYGDLVLVERPYSFRGTFDVEIASDRRNRIQSLMAVLRATPCVFFPSEDDANDGLIIYGFERDFSITYQTPTRTYASLEIEGLT